MLLAAWVSYHLPCVSLCYAAVSLILNVQCLPFTDSILKYVFPSIQCINVRISFVTVSCTKNARSSKDKGMNRVQVMRYTVIHLCVSDGLYPTKHIHL